MQIINKKNPWPKGWGEKTSIMGVINLTPDSFSDGGDLNSTKKILDPGIGFSKDLNQNLEILRNLGIFKNLNLPILIGASRKRFIGEVLNENNPKERDIGTLAISCLCSHLNIDIVRVHNVKLNYQILKVADKIYRK